MDYDNDGIQDFISGSYDPGDVYWIRGLGEGKYAEVKSISDQEGVPLVHHPVEMKRHLDRKEKNEAEGEANQDDAMNDQLASFGSWAAMMDWDDDGDLDMLIGAFDGSLFRRMNVGTRSDPKWSSESVPVLAGGKPLHVHHHANPVVADWNDDGLQDLVVGAGDGSVGWFQNVGSASKPEFDERQQLIEGPSTSIFVQQYLSEGASRAPGTRAQICVHDYNHDGHLDLLVGDYSDVYDLPDQTTKQRKKLAMLVKKQNAIAEKVMAAQDRISKAFKSGDMTNDQAQAEMEEIYAEVKSEFGGEEDPMGKLLGKSRVSGSVWLYLRKPSTTID